MSTLTLRDAATQARRTVDQYPPGVGLVLADWLECRASWHELQDGYGFESTPDTVAARRIADLILGGEES